MKHPIPRSALDDRLAIVGTSGSGKTYGAGSAVELLLEANARVLIVDPLGVWWGLGLDADGKRPSIFRQKEKLVIFGGAHGDMPLLPASGALMGETIAGMAESCILDLSEMGSDAEQRRFMLALLTSLFKHKVRDLLHVIVDEADMWAPQLILDKDGEAPKLLGMMQKIVKRGRVFGFIPWLITQNPAGIAKSVLGQVSGMVAFSLTSSQDRDAIGAWVKGQADEAQWKGIWGTMPTLETGRALIWLPRRNKFEIEAFPRKVTFDSSRAPKRGERVTTKKLVPINLDKLKERLGKVEAEIKANDPKALRAEVARLTRELTLKSTQVADAPAIDPEAIARAEKAGFERAKKEAIEAAKLQIINAVAEIEGAIRPLDEAVHTFTTTIANHLRGLVRERQAITPVYAPLPAGPKPVPRAVPTVAPRKPSPANPVAPTGDGTVSAVQQRVIDACAEMEAICRNAPPRTLVALQCGYENIKSTGFAKALSWLSANGFVRYPTTGTVALTDAGRAIAAPVESPPTVSDLHSRIIGILGPTAGKILTPLIEAYPRPVHRSEVAAASGYENVKSTGFAKMLSRLSSLGFVEYPLPGEVIASDIMFPAGATP